MTNFRYAAFISYAGKDAVFVRKLHGALESYRIPKSLGAFDLLGAGEANNRIYPVFRDREELRAGDLKSELKLALEASNALVVVCSPHSAASQAVQWEIEHFTSLGRANRIFAIIAEDAPSEADGLGATRDLFPPPLCADDGMDMPLAGDARRGKDGFRNAWLKVVAGLVGVSPGDLVNRDRQRRRMQTALASAAGGIVLAAMLSIGGYAYVQASEAEMNRAGTLITAADSADAATAFRYLLTARLIGVRPEQREELDHRLSMLAHRAAPPVSQFISAGMQEPYALEYARDGRTLATLERNADDTQVLTIWSAASGIALARSAFATDEAFELHALDGAWLLAGRTQMRTARVTADNAITFTELSAINQGDTVAVSSDGRSLMAGQRTRIVLRDLQNGQQRGEWAMPACSGSMYCSGGVDIAPRGSRFMVTAADCAVMIIDPASRTPVASQTPPRPPARDGSEPECYEAVLSPDLRYVAWSFDGAGGLFIRPLGGGAEFHSPAHELAFAWRGGELLVVGQSQAFALSPDGRRRSLGALPAPLVRTADDDFFGFEIIEETAGDWFGTARTAEGERPFLWSIAQFPGGFRWVDCGSGPPTAPCEAVNGVISLDGLRLTPPRTLEGMRRSQILRRLSREAWLSDNGSVAAQLMAPFGAPDDAPVTSLVLRRVADAGYLGEFPLTGNERIALSPRGSRAALSNYATVRVVGGAATSPIDLQSLLCPDRQCHNLRDAAWRGEDGMTWLARSGDQRVAVQIEFAHPDQARRTVASGQGPYREILLPDGEHFVEPQRGVIRVLDLSGNVVAQASAQRSWMEDIFTVSGDSSTIVSEGEESYVAWRWREDPQGQHLIAINRWETEPDGFDLSHDGSVLAAVVGDYVEVWTTTGSPRQIGLFPLFGGRPASFDDWPLSFDFDVEQRTLRQANAQTLDWQAFRYDRPLDEAVSAACAAPSSFSDADVRRFRLSAFEACPCAAGATGPSVVRRLSRFLGASRPGAAAPACDAPSAN